MAVLTAWDTQFAFREGYEAYKSYDYCSVVINPFAPESKDAEWWGEGWLAAQQDEKEREDWCEIRANEYVWDEKVDLVGNI